MIFPDENSIWQKFVLEIVRWQNPIQWLHVNHAKSLLISTNFISQSKLVNNKTDPRERPVNGHCTLYGFSARVNAMNENNLFFSSDTIDMQWRNSSFIIWGWKKYIGNLGHFPQISHPHINRSSICLVSRCENSKKDNFCLPFWLNRRFWFSENLVSFRIMIA